MSSYLVKHQNLYHLFSVLKWVLSDTKQVVKWYQNKGIYEV